MNGNFESDKNQNQQGVGDSLAETEVNNNYAQGNVTTMMRDRFELLSAYLDGEVTAAERRQVEDWLTNDPTTKRLYSRLLMMQQSFQAMPVPAAEQSAEELATKVLQRVEGKTKRNLVWRGGAIAALLVAVVAGVGGGRQLFAPQFARSPVPAESDGLIVALNEPLVEIVNPNDLMLGVNAPIVDIPKVGVPTPQKSLPKAQ
ncbi:transmembrane transcriptional regulator (anti-sigma factor) [Oscillatoria nigro-viridis PCC 7112]|uniref:Transmembrane transcriptional regulator (Anti-sigma factor) n=1 Tax=Phormidium nigroviride PCC 7112 TaxID=179408 RepID=K9VGY2_9CYAN|nr:zf-HC2 domain-containing protein [Oscillatoria nigro-viridis]AFZ06495.1 transmembrane transcriptional regulator (anti-sigma factor) [Oscillatoria nigro-viridis PCC 7112]